MYDNVCSIAAQTPLRLSILSAASLQVVQALQQL